MTPSDNDHAPDTDYHVSPPSEAAVDTEPAVSMVVRSLPTRPPVALRDVGAVPQLVGGVERAATLLLDTLDDLGDRIAGRRPWSEDSSSGSA